MEKLILIPAVILSFLFAALSAVHLHWVLGGRWGLEKAVPTVNGRALFEPGKRMTALVAVFLFAGAIVAFWRGTFPDLGPTWIPHLGIWVIAVAFALRAVGDFRYCGFFKRFRGTAFARYDSMIYSPLCAIISGLALWLALAN